jgi:L-ribulose-5-phosphate 3-epimerase
VRAGLRLCADLGARVLLVPFFFKGDIGGHDGVERLRGHLRALAPEAEAAGVVIAIEHTLPAAETVALIDSVGSPNVATYWDMANGIALGYDPLDAIRALGPRIVQVHAKEFVADDGPPGTRERPRFDRLNAAPLGQGGVPLPAVLAALRAIGYDGWVVLETGTFGDHAASARAALEALRHA